MLSTGVYIGMTTQNATFRIPSWNLAKLHSKIAQLNRRAEKLDCPPVDLKVGQPYQINDPSVDPNMVIGDFVPKITVYDVELIGQGPRIEGYTFIGTLDHIYVPYTFIGTLDHIYVPGSVIVKTVPGETVPQQYFHSDGACDHCGKIRMRNETFVLRDEAGEHKQVGRQCVKDFIGHDPKHIVSFLTSLNKFVESLDDEEHWFGGAGAARPWVYNHDRVLMATAAMIRKHGWVPRSAAGVGRIATADQVIGVFNPPRFEVEKWKKWVDSLDISNEEFIQEARNARLWLEQQKPNNEYIHNLMAIHTSEAGVSYNMFGYWCSLISAYQRAQDRLTLNRVQQKVNEYVGTVGQRIDMKVTVVGLHHIDGYYGPTTIVKMLDDRGRTVTWFANADVEMRRDESYEVKATVKKHEEYNEWKQTVVNRLKINKVLSGELPRNHSDY
jgi:hypothetical protein